MFAADTDVVRSRSDGGVGTTLWAIVGTADDEDDNVDVKEGGAAVADDADVAPPAASA